MSRRFGRRQRRQMKLRLRELEGDYDLMLGAVMAMRDHTKAGLGINCSFVDDETWFMVALSQRAILAGLADDISPKTLAIVKAHVEQFRAAHETSLGRSLP